MRSARHGFDIDVSAMNNAGGTIAAMSGGSLEMGLGDLFLFVVAMLRGAPIELLAPSALYVASEPSAYLAAAAINSPIRTPHRSRRQDLGGPFAAFSCGEFTVRAWLSQNNVDPGQVKFIELTQPAMVPAMERGTIDAGIMATEPFITLFKSRIRDVGHPYDVIGKESPFSVWYATKRWIDADKTRAREAVTAIYETGRWCNDHRADTAAILARDAQIDSDVVKRMTRVTFGTVPFTPADVQPSLDLA